MLPLLFISGGWNTFIQWGTPALMLSTKTFSQKALQSTCRHVDCDALWLKFGSLHTNVVSDINTVPNQIADKGASGVFFPM